MAGHDIFISYSREDRSTAGRFADCLADEGFTVWWDAALHSGETFDEVIEAELKAAKAVVVLWSPRSVTSRWVRAEATLADRRNKLTPVIIEACDRPIIFELTHTADLSGWTGDRSDPAWKGLVRDLRRLVGSGAVPASAAPDRTAKSELGRTTGQPMARSPERAGAGSTAGQWRGPRSSNDAPAVAYEATQFYSGPTIGRRPLPDRFHCLEIRADDRLEKRYVVNPLGLKIGRSAPADVILADQRVSRTHCLVELAGEHLLVTDLKSTNGTFIDGKRIQGSAPLQIGSELKVGAITLTHVVRSEAEV